MTARHNLWLIKRALLLSLLLPFTAVAQPGTFVPPPAPVYTDFATITAPVVTGVCNCYAFVKSVYPSLPSMNEVIGNVTATGSVAVFYYPEVGLHHFAVVRRQVGERILIEETNYSRCRHGFRWITKEDPALLGFFIPR